MYKPLRPDTDTWDIIRSCGGCDDTDHVVEAMRQQGYEWNNYYCFINITHPCYLACKGLLPLTSSTFDSIYCDIPVFEMPPYRHDREERAGVLMNKIQGMPSSDRYSYWSNSKLKEEIVRLGLTDTRSHTFEDESEIPIGLRDILTLSILTGDERDVCIPLPGLGIPFYPKGDYIWKEIETFWHEWEASDDDEIPPNWHTLVYWKTQCVKKSYLIAVYKALITRNNRLMWMR
jgi:hypothetical protein